MHTEMFNTEVSSGKIRVAYVVSTLEGFGLVRMILALVKSLDKKKIDPVIITLSREPRNTLIQSFKELGIPVYSLGLSRMRGMVCAHSRLGQMVKELNVDVVHSHGFRANLVAKNASLGQVPHLLTLHSDPKSEPKHYLGFLFYIWRRMKIFDLARQSHNLVACSKTVANVYKNKGIDAQVIQNGIFIDKNSELAIIEKEKQRLRSEWGIGDGIRIGIVVAGLTPNKNIATIVNAFNLLPANYLLLVAGEGRERIHLEKLGGSNCRFLGYRGDVPDLYRMADFYLSASLSEGLSLALMEAMQQGLIPIISNIPSHLEVLSGTCFEKLAFDCYDFLGLKEKIAGLSEKDVENYRKQAVHHIEGKFLSSRMAQEYENLYFRLVNKTIS